MRVLAISGSHIWRGIKVGLDVVRQWLVWEVGSGLETSFWMDSWLPLGLLFNQAIVPINEIAKTLPIRAFWDDNLG